jgi:hypothetical protein
MRRDDTWIEIETRRRAAGPKPDDTQKFAPRRLPEHRCSPICSRTKEIPLSAAIVARERNQFDPLIQVAKLKANPSATPICRCSPLAILSAVIGSIRLATAVRPGAA